MVRFDSFTVVMVSLISPSSVWFSWKETDPDPEPIDISLITLSFFRGDLLSFFMMPYPWRVAATVFPASVKSTMDVGLTTSPVIMTLGFNAHKSFLLKSSHEFDHSNPEVT